MYVYWRHLYWRHLLSVLSFEEKSGHALFSWSRRIKGTEYVSDKIPWTSFSKCLRIYVWRSLVEDIDRTFLVNNETHVRHVIPQNLRLQTGWQPTLDETFCSLVIHALWSNVSFCLGAAFWIHTLTWRFGDHIGTLDQRTELKMFFLFPVQSLCFSEE